VIHARLQVGFVLPSGPAAGVRLTTRASAPAITPSGAAGYLLFPEPSYAFHLVPLRLCFRSSLCSTGGWDSRLYAWENDLLSSFSVPALYGEATRLFLMLSWKSAEKMEARVKYAFTDSRNGLKQEVKGQVRISF